MHRLPSCRRFGGGAERSGGKVPGSDYFGGWGARRWWEGDPTPPPPHTTTSYQPGAAQSLRVFKSLRGWCVVGGGGGGKVPFPPPPPPTIPRSVDKSGKHLLSSACDVKFEAGKVKQQKNSPLLEKTCNRSATESMRTINILRSQTPSSRDENKTKDRSLCK